LVLLKVLADANPVHHPQFKQGEIEAESEAYVAEHLSKEVCICQNFLISFPMPEIKQVFPWKGAEI
jgi:hypothetical protein